MPQSTARLTWGVCLQLILGDPTPALLNWPLLGNLHVWFISQVIMMQSPLRTGQENGPYAGIF